MLLTEERVHAVALDARKGFRECLYMLDMHDRDSGRAYLNGPIVIVAAATWERFVLDLIGAAETAEGWDPVEHWFDPNDASGAPWPDGERDQQWRAKRKKSGLDSSGHCLDLRLKEAGVLGEGTLLTSYWQINLATSWTGSDPDEWVQLPDPGRTVVENFELLKMHLLGAKSARDAVAHRLFYKKARQADGQDPDKADELMWHYVWASDNTSKTNVKVGKDKGRPTVQNGYARGVVALFLQLVDCTIAVIRERHDWYRSDSRLPWQWFEPSITEGKVLADARFWNGQRLTRRS